jgi:hypothetical protein
MKGLTFGKTVLLVIGALAFALVSCVGALSGSNTALYVGGGGFALGMIATVFGMLRLFYLTVVWVVSRGSKPPENPSA